MKRVFTLFLALAMVLTLAGISPAARAEDKFNFGSTQDNTYWNETLKIGCTLDENWYFLNEEEILQANSMTAEKLDGKLAEMVKEGGSMIDMFAQNLETGATVNLVVERLSVVNSLVIDEKKYLDISQSTLDEAMAQMGIEDVEITQESMDFLGQEHQSIVITGSFNGVPVCETMVVVKSGRNMTIITVFSAVEGEVEEVLASFFDSLD